MKNFSEIILIFFAVSAFLVVSCTERIDIKTDNAPPRVVIYGYITTDTISVSITRSAGYFTTERPEGVSNARVTITDCAENEIALTENDKTPGLYHAAPKVYGAEGKTYTLDIELYSGEQYQATAYLQHVHHIDYIELRPSTFPMFSNHVEVLLYAHNYEQRNFYSIFVAINDVVVNSNINRFFVLDNTFFREEYINGEPCYWLNQNPHHEYRNEVLRIGDKVTLNINAISQEYATFISNVQSEIRGSNPIFGGPPANVPTNIKRIYPKDGIPPVGFFTAFPSRYAHAIVTEELFRN